MHDEFSALLQSVMLTGTTRDVETAPGSAAVGSRRQGGPAREERRRRRTVWMAAVVVKIRPGRRGSIGIWGMVEIEMNIPSCGIRTLSDQRSSLKFKSILDFQSTPTYNPNNQNNQQCNQSDPLQFLSSSYSYQIWLGLNKVCQHEAKL